jgi:isopenicillin-N epimerase
MASRFADFWALDPSVTFLNHGSFGACPRTVLSVQDALRARMEAAPIEFLGRKLEGAYDDVRARLGALLACDADDLALVTNATSGVNTVLRSLSFRPGDEILITDHGYNACNNAARWVADRFAARVTVATIPFPVESEDVVVERIVAAVTPATRLAIVDHVTSPTGLVFPIGRICRELAARNVDVLVDGAHAPGMVALDLDALGAAYYTGNCHKWLCAPKAAAFLHVRRDRQAPIVPLTISHGRNSDRTDRSRFRIDFDWVGTVDPTPWLAIPAALDFLSSLFPGGLPALYAHNRALALAARTTLCEALGVPVPSPASMIGTLAAVPLPGKPRRPAEELQRTLFDAHRIEVPMVPWGAARHPLVRISAQAYNDVGDYEALARALVTVLEARA